jgi:hypothetical protein
MEPKPELFASDYGSWWDDPLVVEAYPLQRLDREHCG